MSENTVATTVVASPARPKRKRNSPEALLTAVHNHTHDGVLDVKAAAAELGITVGSFQSRCSTIRNIFPDLPKGQQGQVKKSDAQKAAEAAAIWAKLEASNEVGG